MNRISTNPELKYYTYAMIAWFLFIRWVFLAETYNVAWTSNNAFGNIIAVCSAMYVGIVALSICNNGLQTNFIWINKLSVFICNIVNDKIIKHWVFQDVTIVLTSIHTILLGIMGTILFKDPSYLHFFGIIMDIAIALYFNSMVILCLQNNKNNNAEKVINA